MTQRYLKLFKTNKTNRGFIYPSTGNISDINNIDISSNSCVYGLYFSKPEDILKYLTNETVSIQEVSPVTTLYLDSLNQDKYRTKTLNLIETEKNLSLVSTWEWLKSEFNIDFTINDNCAIQYACIMGYVDVIDYLLTQGCNFSAQNYFAIYSAIYSGNMNVLYHIVNDLGYGLTEIINETFVRLCKLGNISDLEIFYNTISIKPDITYDEHKAFRLTCFTGNITMVEYLIDTYYGRNNQEPWFTKYGQVIKQTALLKKWDVLYLTTNTSYYDPILNLSSYRRFLLLYAKEQNDTIAIEWCYNL